MKLKKTLGILLILALVLAMTLSGCAGSSGDARNGSTSSTASYYYDEGEYYDYGYEDGDAPGQEAAKGEENGADTSLPQKLVYTASVTLETRDLTAALESVNGRLREAGGTVQEQQITGLTPGLEDDTASYNGYSSYTRPSATLTIRVPSENFNSFLAGLQTEQELFTVQEVSARTENLTRQYYDLDSRVKALRTEEEWLLEAMEKAENVSELLEIRDRLTEVRWEIESLTNSVQTIDYDAAWSTVTLRMTQVKQYTPKEEAGLGERLGSYFGDSVEGFLTFLEGFLHLLILALPYLVILAIILVIVIVVAKRSNKKRAKKMAAFQAQAQPPQEQEKK